MILRKACPASVDASAWETGGRRRSLSQSHQLISGQGQDAKHQAPYHLGAAFDPDIVAAKLVLEPGIATFRDGALVVANRVGRLEFLFLATTRIVINQGNMAQATAVLVQLPAAIGGIHDVIETGDAFSTDQRQRNGGTAVMHRGRRQQRRDGHPAVGGVEVQLVAVPADFVALGIALRAAITRGRDVLDHLCQGLLALATNGRLLGRRTGFTPPGASPPLRRGGRFRRARHHFRLGLEQVRLRRGHGRLDFASRRTLASVDGGAIPAEVPDQFITQIRLDERLMDAFRQWPSENSSKAREKVASEGNFLHIGKPQMRRRARSMLRRSISAAVVASPSTALAAKVFASQARSCGWRPTPHHPEPVNSSMRTHSRIWMTFSSFGVSGPTSLRSSGSSSC